ncbi:MAG: S41 family peptidase [Caldilineaceae bacterium]|nr:S41 family peptidase [Caldilineaceae bacterium]
MTQPEYTPSSIDRSSDGLYRQPWLLAGVALLLMLATFGLGLALGYGWGRTATQASGWLPAARAQGDDADLQGAKAALYPAFGLYWEAMDLLYRDFYGTPPDAETATYSAIRGVLDTLDDPNTNFLTPQEADSFRSNMSGVFEGIGARVAWDEEADTLVIVEPFENQPAWAAGLRRGDLILAVDGESIVGTSLSAAVSRIRGPKGSEVMLSVQRGREGAPFGVTVARARVEIPTINTSTLGPNGEIAYIRLNAFNENAGQLVREAVRAALQRDPQGLVFDLRGNSGGLLREAVKVASVFMEDQVVLHEHLNGERSETYRTVGSALTTDLPMVVLVDEGTASASEIVAGALQDASRATLLGTQTYGKGSVQLPHNLSNGSILRVTIARWYTPLERTIDGVGLVPDQVVETTQAQLDRGDDPQLAAALAHFTTAQTAQPEP